MVVEHHTEKNLPGKREKEDMEDCRQKDGSGVWGSLIQSLLGGLLIVGSISPSDDLENIC